jgi:Cobalamin synthesis protein cobW C-terminal domain
MIADGDFIGPWKDRDPRQSRIVFIGRNLSRPELRRGFEAEDKRVAAATESLGHRLGFALDHRTVELTGICAICRTEGGGATTPCI